MTRSRATGAALVLPGATAPSKPSRAARRRRAAKEPPALLPWHCVVLAVDTAATSGWSLRIAGHQHEFGEVDTLDRAAVEYIVRWAGHRAERVGLPLVLVLEKPWGGSVTMVSALGAARERWMAAWRWAGRSPNHVVLVQPGTWRGPVLGKRWVSAPRDEVRAYEQQVATWMVGEPVGGDEAAAICIGGWAAHARAVGKVIGKRARDASQRKWEG